MADADDGARRYGSRGAGVAGLVPLPPGHRGLAQGGYRIEARQLATAARLERCPTRSSVIARRPYRLAGRRCVAGAPLRIHRTPARGPAPMAPAVRWLARLGEFLTRAHDGEPGAAALWHGLQHLANLTATYGIMHPAAAHPDV